MYVGGGVDPQTTLRTVIQVLRIEPWSSGREASTFNYESSLQPLKHHLKQSFSTGMTTKPQPVLPRTRKEKKRCQHAP